MRGNDCNVIARRLVISLVALLAVLRFSCGDVLAAPPGAAFPFDVKLRACLAIPATTEVTKRSECLTEVATALERGLIHEMCQGHALGANSCPEQAHFTRERSFDCRNERDISAAARTRCEFLELAVRLLGQLRGGDSTDPVLTGQLAQEFLVRRARRTYTLVSQGGVSLGNWQAGYAYVITEYLKSLRVAPMAPVYQSAVGASAGAVNALAFGLEGCRSNQRHPKSTLAWKLWVEHLRLFPARGRPGLLDEPASNSFGAALFSDAPLRAAMDDARREMLDVSSELSSACSFNLGFVATHLVGATAPLHARLSPDGEVQNGVITAPRASERFAVTASVQPSATHGVNGSIDFRNFFELRAQTDQTRASVIPDEAFFAQLGSGSQPTSNDVLEGIRASGAFPFAFPPVAINYRAYDVKARHFLPKAGWFVDGGVLENTPLGLAAAINRYEAQGRVNPWLGLADNDIYIYISPGVRVWTPEYRGLDPANTAPGRRPLGTYLDWLGSIVGAGSMARLAQAAEEYAFLRQDRDGNDLASRMIAPVRYLPITGDHLAHFFAFTEREFRVFDFVVGMVDANANLSRITSTPAATFEFPASPAGEVDPDRLADKYSCVRAFYRQCILSDGALEADCGDVPRLPKQCDDIEPRFRALLKANWHYRRWIESSTMSNEEEKDEFEVFLGMLSTHGFEFKDAPGVWKDALDQGASKRFQRQLADVALERLTEKENWFIGKSLRLGSRIIADATLYREFPGVLLQLGYPERGLEAGFGLKLASFGEYAGLRLDILGRFYGYRSQYVIAAQGAYYEAKMLNADSEIGLTGIVSPGLPGVLDIETSVGPLASLRTMPWHDGGHWVFVRHGLHWANSLVLLQRMYLRFENQWFWAKDMNRYFVGTTQEDAGSYRLQVSLGLRFMLQN